MHTIDFLILAAVAALAVYTVVRIWKRRGQCHCGSCGACAQPCAKRPPAPDKRQRGTGE